VTVAVSEEREWDPDAANIYSNKHNTIQAKLMNADTSREGKLN